MDSTQASIQQPSPVQLHNLNQNQNQNLQTSQPRVPQPMSTYPSPSRCQAVLLCRRSCRHAERTAWKEMQIPCMRYQPRKANTNDRPAEAAPRDRHPAGPTRWPEQHLPRTFLLLRTVPVAVRLLYHLRGIWESGIMGRVGFVLDGVVIRSDQSLRSRLGLVSSAAQTLRGCFQVSYVVERISMVTSAVTLSIY
jgi:hypothetical protein